MMKNSLEVGDIIITSNALFGQSEHAISKIEGNKAYEKDTGRVLNKKIYPGGRVYEYGKTDNQWSNSYWIKKGGR